MTPRRRRPGTGSSDSSGQTPSPETRRPTGGTGTSGTGVDPDNIDTMAGRLDATETKVGAVGGRVERVDVGQGSMGVVGSGFTGAARTHLTNAKALIQRVRDRVGQAREGTRATARQYRDTEAANAERVGGIESRSDIPRTGTAGQHTTPSATTTPGGTAQPPPTTRDPRATHHLPGRSATASAAVTTVGRLPRAEPPRWVTTVPGGSRTATRPRRRWACRASAGSTSPG